MIEDRYIYIYIYLYIYYSIFNFLIPYLYPVAVVIIVVTYIDVGVFQPNDCCILYYIPSGVDGNDQYAAGVTG